MISKSLKYFLLIVIFLIGGLIWWVIDWHSPHHWIEINPIVDASTQKEGFSGFVLPSGNYVVVISGDSRIEQGSKMEISYVLAIPDLAIRIEKQKKVDVGFVANTLLDEVQIKKDKTEGYLSVRVLTPSKGKVSVGLVSNKFAGM